MSNISIKDTISDFLNYCIFEKGLSDRTKNSYQNDLDIYLKYLITILIFSHLQLTHLLVIH